MDEGSSPLSAFNGRYLYYVPSGVVMEAQVSTGDGRWEVQMASRHWLPTHVLAGFAPEQFGLFRN